MEENERIKKELAPRKIDEPKVLVVASAAALLGRYCTDL